MLRIDYNYIIVSLNFGVYNARRRIENKQRTQVSSDKDRMETKRGEDIDTYWYDELNEKEELVAQYIVYDITSMHPPFGRTIKYDRI